MPTNLPVAGDLSGGTRTRGEVQASLAQLRQFLEDTLGTVGGAITITLISADTISEKTTGNGVVVDGLAIKDGGITLLEANPRIMSNGSIFLDLDLDNNATDAALLVRNNAALRTILELTDEGQLTLDNEAGGVMLRVVDAAAATAADANPAVQFGYRTAAGGAFVALGKIEIAAGSEDVNIVPTGLGKLTVAGQQVWHAGNDGVGSGLDADTLQGLTPAQIGTSAGKLISSADLAGGEATVDITGFDEALYDWYRVVFNALRSSSNGAELWLRTSANGGVSFDAGSNSYLFIGTKHRISGGALSAVVFGSAAIAPNSTEIEIAENVSSAAGSSGVSGHIDVIFPHVAGVTNLNGATGGRDTSGQMLAVWSGCRDASQSVDAVRLLFSAGTFGAGGTVSLYGFKNA